MARKKVNKSEHKTVRLTGQANFSVTFFAQLDGQSGNAFLEAAVQHYARHLAEKRKLPIGKIWHVHDGVRELRWFALSDDVYPFDDEQQKRRDFVMRHLDFFYEVIDDVTLIVREDNARELWPRIAEFEAVKGNHWAPGVAMAKHLDARGLPAPSWPPVQA